MAKRVEQLPLISNATYQIAAGAMLKSPQGRRRRKPIPTLEQQVDFTAQRERQEGKIARSTLAQWEAHCPELLVEADRLEQTSGLRKVLLATWDQPGTYTKRDRVARMTLGGEMLSDAEIRRLVKIENACHERGMNRENPVRVTSVGTPALYGWTTDLLEALEDE